MLITMAQSLFYRTGTFLFRSSTALLPGVQQHPALRRFALFSLSFSPPPPKRQPLSKVALANANTKALKKPKPTKVQQFISSRCINAFSTATEYDLEKYRHALLEDGRYNIVSLSDKANAPDDDPVALHMSAAFKTGDPTADCKDIFVFREGSVVFWNVPHAERDIVLAQLRKFEDSPYRRDVTIEEMEELYFAEGSDGNTTLVGDTVFLRNPNLLTGENGLSLPSSSGLSSDPKDNVVILEKYAISNATIVSVKLAVYERLLGEMADEIETIIEDMKAGNLNKLKPKNVLKLTGEVLSLRHRISLSSDLLDTPDFYWDRSHLEALYLRMAQYFSVKRRTNVMNERLDYILELMDVLSTRLANSHSVRLERIIILLIMIEVLFEFAHFVTYFMK